MPLLEVAQLAKSYDSHVAVDGVSFSVAAGEVFGLLGPNGAGKTTTMLMLAGLLKPDAGRIAIDGRPFEPGNPEMKKMLGLVPQDLAIYPDLTARENLSFFGRLYGLRGVLLQERIDVALERTGLKQHALSQVTTFSGGMKRRLNFGIALLHEPRLLILDEPTVGVDPQSRSHLLDCVRDLSAAGMAVLYASHYMEEVQAICHRVGIMDHGKMLACGALDELLGRLESALCLRVASVPDERLAVQLRDLAEVRRDADGEATVVLDRRAGDDSNLLASRLMQVLEALRGAGVELRAVETHEPNLERLFLKLTGSRLRD
jgi:ABC-2 type transport system ATP-binding protein